MAGGSPSSVASFNAPLPASPSMVSNNLCCLSSHVAYASAADVLLTPLKSFMARKHETTSLKMTHKVTNTHNNNADTGVRIQGVTTVRIGTDQHLVVLGTDGVRIFDGKTATRLEFSLPTPKDNDLFAARTRPSEKYADRGAYCSCACSARSDDGRTQVGNVTQLPRFGFLFFPNTFSQPPFPTSFPTPSDASDPQGLNSNFMMGTGSRSARPPRRPSTFPTPPHPRRHLRVEGLVATGDSHEHNARTVRGQPCAREALHETGDVALLDAHHGAAAVAQAVGE